MPQLFVVDPCFKEQFSLPNATPEYQSLWNDLPNLFVGTAEQLVPVVELMCTQVSSRHPSHCDRSICGCPALLWSSLAPLVRLFVASVALG